MRSQRGQTSAELMGMLLIAAAIVAAVIAGVPGKIAGGTLHAVCRITAQDCGGNTALASTGDADGDGVPDGRDPVPNSGDIDHDGLDDGEEIALGTDPRNPDSDGDHIPDGEEYHAGTDPTKGVLPWTKDNQFKPWERVGLTGEQWAALEKTILDQVNPGGIKGFLLGNPYIGVTLDKDGNFELLTYTENGIPVRGLLELLGVAGEEGGASAIRAALSKLPTAAREALTSRGLLPNALKAVKPPEPPPFGTAFNELDSLGRPTGAAATITEDTLGTGSSAAPGIRPPGFEGQAAGQARGHLIARLLGGAGNDSRNLVTLYQNPVNTPIMSGFEREVANAARAGETVRYEVTPIYRGDELVPRAVTLRATGSRGFNLHVTILNEPAP